VLALTTGVLLNLKKMMSTLTVSKIPTIENMDAIINSFQLSSSMGFCKHSRNDMIMKL
jgi:hypothetical protein